MVLVLVGAVVLASILWRRGSPNVDSNSTFATTTNLPAPVNTSSPAPTGSAPVAMPTKPNFKVSSPVVLEEYGDYQCPPCGQLYPELKKIELEYGNQVQIVFHHFPLNEDAQERPRRGPRREAARNQKKFWEMHDRLYRNQSAWAEAADPLQFSFLMRANLG